MLNRYLLFPLTALLLLAAPRLVQAQTGAVGIGTTAPDASAALDIVASAKGLLLPRLTAAQVAAIASPATGLLVFQTDGTAGFYYNAGTPAAPAWQQLTTASGAALTFGNGLTQTGSTVGLGGTLTKATTLGLAGYTLGLTGGNVGIGTASPTQVLDVNGGILARGNGLISNQGSYLQWNRTGEGETWLLNQLGGSNNAGGIRFGGADQSNNVTEWARFDNNGNLYLGLTTPDPSYRLSVNGATRLFGGCLIFGYSEIYGRLEADSQVDMMANAHVYGTLTVGDPYKFGGSMVQLSGGGLTFADGTTQTTAVTNGGNLIFNQTSQQANANFNISGNGIVGGSVGIGTSSPSQKLEVAGSVKISGGGNGLTFPDGTTQTTAAANGGNLIFNQTSQQANANFNISGSGVVGGNLGVGTSSPAGQLANTASNVLGTDGNGISGQGLGWANTSSLGYAGVFYNANNAAGGGGLAVKIASTVAAALDVSQGGSAGTAGTPLLRVNGNGNVGIGTSSPNQPLTVQAGAASNSPLLGFYSSAGTDKFNFSLAGGGLNLGESKVAGGRLFLQPGGNVGIGTITPSQKLDVNGNANVSGNSSVSGSSYVGGSMGIGTTSPSQKLDVAGNANVSGNTTTGGNSSVGGNANVSGNSSVSGSSYVGGSMGIGTSSPSQALDVAGGILARASGAISQQGVYLQWNRSGGGGETWLLNQQGLGAGGIRFGQSDQSSNATEWARFDSNGNLGIGTASPIAKLHVSGNASATPSGGGTSYFSATTPLQGPGIPSGSGARATAAYFDGGQVWVNSVIVAGSLNTTSDQRIKHVIGLSNRTADLALLNKLRITDYTYIDQVNNTPGLVKKVIAQEVEEVLPTAVSRSRQALPNVYEKATKVSYAQGLLTVTTAKPHELPASGGRMRFYTPANESLDVEVTVVDVHTVRFASPEAHASGLFVYGKYVDDFRSVDYDALTTLNVSATQELARKVAALEATNAALQAGAAAAAATLETFEARLRRLEAGTAQVQR